MAQCFDRRLRAGEVLDVLRGRVLGVLFFQPSTRTRMSFETAMLRLGGGVTGFADPAVTRAGDFYRERLEDVARVASEYADVLALRHPENGAAARAAAKSRVPLLNAGDGYNQHPTQALGDLFAMHREHRGLDGLTIGLVGPLRIRSLRAICTGLSRFDVRILVVTPPGGLDADVIRRLDESGTRWELRRSVDQLIHEVDVLETIGVNHPDHNLARDVRSASDQRTPDEFRLTAAKLAGAGEGLTVLHPMPRTDELDPDVDALPHARYFQQCRDGMLMRMALIAAVLSPTHNPHDPQETTSR